MNKFLFSLLIFLTSTVLSAQPGIYSESDIEFQTLFLDAQIEKHKGNTEKVIEILKNVIKRDKQSDAAYYELAKAYKAEGDFELAQKNALKATKINPHNNWYLLLLAEVYEDVSQYNKAAMAYQSLIQLDDKNPILYHRLALNQLNLNMPNEAAATLETLQNKTSITEETSRRLFDIYSKNQQQEKALKTLTNLSEQYPDTERFLANLASYLYDIGRNDEAIKTFEKVLKINPNNALASIAVAKAQNSNDTNSSNPTNYLTKLFPLIENKEIPLDDKIKELMPFLTKMERGSETIKELLNISESLIKLYPDNVKALAVRGDVLFYSGDFDSSEKSYAKAIELDDKKYTLWDQWMINLWQISNYKKLQTVSYDALDYFPNQTNAFIIHSIALAQNDKLDEANSFLDEAMFVAGKNNLLLNIVEITRLWCNSDNKSKEEISNIITNVDTNQITNPIFIELIGDLYDTVGDSPNSKKYWQLAIQLGAKEARLQKKIGV